MDELKQAIDSIPALAIIVGSVFWFGRLEGRYFALEKQVDALSMKHDELDSRISAELVQVRESLARIEGALGVKSG